MKKHYFYIGMSIFFFVLMMNFEINKAIIDKPF